MIQSQLNFFFFGHTARFVGSYFPDQGLNACPWEWKCWIWTTGSPGYSPQLNLKKTNFYHFSLGITLLVFFCPSFFFPPKIIFFCILVGFPSHPVIQGCTIWVHIVYGHTTKKLKRWGESTINYPHLWLTPSQGLNTKALRGKERTSAEGLRTYLCWWPVTWVSTLKSHSAWL